MTEAQPVAYIDVVFDGPPSHESGRFVEVENPDGASVNAGEWINRENGLWALRIGLSAPPDASAREAMRDATREMISANPEAARLEMADMARELRELREFARALLRESEAK